MTKRRAVMLLGVLVAAVWVLVAAGQVFGQGGATPYPTVIYPTVTKFPTGTPYIEATHWSPTQGAQVVGACDAGMIGTGTGTPAPDDLVPSYLRSCGHCWGYGESSGAVTSTKVPGVGIITPVPTVGAVDVSKLRRLDNILRNFPPGFGIGGLPGYTQLPNYEEHIDAWELHERYSDPIGAWLMSIDDNRAGVGSSVYLQSPFNGPLVGAIVYFEYVSTSDFVELYTWNTSDAPDRFRYRGKSVFTHNVFIDQSIAGQTGEKVVCFSHSVAVCDYFEDDEVMITAPGFPSKDALTLGFAVWSEGGNSSAWRITRVYPLYTDELDDGGAPTVTPVPVTATPALPSGMLAFNAAGANVLEWNGNCNWWDSHRSVVVSQKGARGISYVYDSYCLDQNNAWNSAKFYVPVTAETNVSTYWITGIVGRVDKLPSNGYFEWPGYNFGECATKQRDARPFLVGKRSNQSYAQEQQPTSIVDMGDYYRVTWDWSSSPGWVSGLNWNVRSCVTAAAQVFEGSFQVLEVNGSSVYWPTPAATVVPTGTPVGMPTASAPGSCAPVQWRDKTPAVDIALDEDLFTDGGCYSVVPGKNYVFEERDFTLLGVTLFSMPGFSLEVPDVELCVTYVKFPSLELFGYAISLQWFLLPIVAWFVRFLARL